MSSLKIGLISSSCSAQREKRMYESRGAAEVVKYRRKEKREERNTVGMESDRNNQSSEQLTVFNCLESRFLGTTPLGKCQVNLF